MTSNHGINYRIYHHMFFFSGFFYHGACASTFASPEGFPFPCYPDRKALSAQPIYKRHCSSWNHFMLYLNRVSVMGIPPTMKQVCLIPLKGYSAIMSVSCDDISATHQQPQGGFITMLA